jgi:hypothetical protein
MTAAVGLGFDDGVVAAMGMRSCAGNRGGHRSSDNAATEKEREEEKRNEERRKKKRKKRKKRKRKKMKVRKHIGYKWEVYYIFLRNCES